MNDRKYMIVVINEKTGKKYASGFAPASHATACTLMSKMTQHQFRRIQLEEVI